MESKMLRSVLVLLFFSLLTIFVFTLLSASAEAKTITVDDDGGEDYEKIQWAIENATAGDTVRVYEGIYEEMFAIDVRINLTGSDAANTTIVAPEKGDVILVREDWVNVSGFGVVGKGSDSVSADIKVEGNHTRIFRNNCTENDYGIRLLGNHSIISNNSCKENQRDGIWLLLSENSVVTNNECDQNGFYGIRASASENCIISNNSCENNTYGISFSNCRNGGVSGNSCSNNIHGITISSDSILVNNNHCFLNDNGITIWLNSHYNTLESNMIMNNQNGTLVDARSSRNEIRNCVFSGNEIGILLKDNCRENTAFSNEFRDNSEYGIYALDNDGYTIDAADNWWGHSSGPNHFQNNSQGQGDELTDYVLFGPWIRQTESIHNIRKGTSYLRIQDAVDDASWGDSIRVYEGLYEETLIINRTLSLIGNGSAFSVINGGGSGDLLLIEEGANWCNVSGFNFTGAEAASSDMKLNSSHNHIFGNLFENDNAKGISMATSSHHNVISNNSVANKSYGIHLSRSSSNSISNNSLSNNYGAVYCTNPGSRYNIISNNSFDLNTHATWLRNSASRTTVSHNTYLNNGYGIFIQNSDTNTLSNNHLSENSRAIWCQSSDFNSIFTNIVQNNENVGIYLFGSDSNAISNNSIWNNPTGIHLFSSADSNTITDCSINDNDEGIRINSSRDNKIHQNNIYNNRNFGINVTVSIGSPTNASLNWWGFDSGPYHPVSNGEGKGDNVSDHVKFDPWRLKRRSTPPKAFIDSVQPHPAAEGAVVRFSGHAVDDFGIARYVWSSSLDGEFYNGTESECSNSSLSVGSHLITLHVQDTDGYWSKETHTTLTVHEQPTASIVSVSPSPALDSQNVTLRASGNDDGELVRFAWRSSENGELYNGTEFEFTSSSLSLGEHTLYLKVMDNHGAWSKEISTSLSIHKRPTAEITHIEPKAVSHGEAVHFTGRGTDDGGIVSYVWRSSKDGEFYNGTKTRTDFSGFSVGEHSIYFKVKDNDGVWSEEVSGSLTIRALPQAHIRYISPNPVIKGEKIEFSGSGSDDGSITRYTWRSSLDGEFYNGTRSSFDNSGLSAGEHTIFFKVKDNNGVWSQEVNTSLTVRSAEGSGDGDSTGFMKLILYLGLGGVVLFVLLFFLPSRKPQEDQKGAGSEDEEDQVWDDQSQDEYQGRKQEEEDDEDFLPPVEESDDEDFAAPLEEDEDEILPPLTE